MTKRSIRARNASRESFQCPTAFRACVREWIREEQGLDMEPLKYVCACRADKDAEIYWILSGLGGGKSIGSDEYIPHWGFVLAIRPNFMVQYGVQQIDSLVWLEGFWWRSLRGQDLSSHVATRKETSLSTRDLLRRDDEDEF